MQRVCQGASENPASPEKALLVSVKFVEIMPDVGTSDGRRLRK